jgi:hypothetical protein
MQRIEERIRTTADLHASWEPKTLVASDSPATQRLLAQQAAAIVGEQGAVMWSVSTKDAVKLVERQLDALPVSDGMIAPGIRVPCSCRNM